MAMDYPCLASCAAYRRSRLAAVYDPLNPPAEDIRFFEELAGTEPLRILDVGSGTGRFACLLADRGHSVTGVEPAPGMMGVARHREGSDRVIWIEAGAADFEIETRFDLITMTGHVFQVFLDDDEVRAVLANAARHLAEGGRLALETRNPLDRDWETWTPEETTEDVEVPDVGSVRVHCDIAEVDGERVTFETHFRFPDGEVVVAPHTLRFMTRERLAAFLAEAGFAKLDWYGDHHRSAWSPESPEIIVVAGR